LNWSNAQEILEHKGYKDTLKFIEETVKKAPHFIFEGKSESKTAKKRINTCQEHLNCYFEYKFNSNGWQIQPLIGIGDQNDDKDQIELKADFRKTINNRVLQIEIQCGNNSRFYADLIKFQMAWLQKLTDVAILIVPMNNYALRIGENICNFERLERELPYLRPVLQLPILVIGFEPDRNSKVYDLKKMSYSILSSTNLSVKQKYAYVKEKKNRNRNIQALIYNNLKIEDIDENTPLNKDMIPKS
jgi:hypothetical protein